MGYNKRNDEINAITKESIAFAYYEEGRSVPQRLLPQFQLYR